MRTIHYGHWCSTLLMAVAIAFPTNAQVIPDGSVGTTVSAIGSQYTINNGTQVGGNLFHSFSQFSVPTGGAARFNNALTVQTIFARVTGGSVSNIDGLLQTNGRASLFLLNPAGILFGPNASLNLGGSLVATTANSIKFADGKEFNATRLTGMPLLTMSVPIGLQMGQNPGAITVQGKGNDGIVPTSNLGIVSKPGKTIALVGGDITFSSGVITAPAGRIEVGAVNSGIVSLTPTPAGWQLGYAQAQDLRDISFSARSSLWNPYPIGNPFGGIQVVGRDVTLNQSQIAAATAGNGQGGNITVNAARSLSLGGVNARAGAPSAWIVNQVAQGAKGNGGAVNIQAGNVSLQDGAAIETLSLGSGAAGRVQVKAGTIFANGAVSVNSQLALGGSSASRIASTTYTTGAGGNIDVTAQKITLIDSGHIGTFVMPGATGQGGTVTVRATEGIAATGISSLTPVSSGIGTYSFGVGSGGDINVSTATLQLIDSANIVAFTSRIAGIANTGIGKAGNVTAIAQKSIEITGVSSNRPNQISYLGSITTGANNTGNVTVIAPRLTLQSGGGLGTITLPVVGNLGDLSQANHLGNAGNVTLNIADLIEVSGSNPFTQTPSTLGTATFGNGNAGNLTIQTNQLVVRDGSTINSVTEASGNAGSLNIQAQDILVEGRQSQRSSIASSAVILNQTTRQAYNLPDFPTGNTGTLTISTERLTVRNSGVVSVIHQGTGNAGQLKIQATAVILDYANIGATTASGQGGNITLQATDLLLMRHGSNITATAGGNGNGGNITINAPIVAGFENSDIVANAVKGRGGNINITTQGIIGLKYRDQLTPESDITASSQFGVNGTVQVNNIGVDPNSGLVKLPTNVVDTSQQIATGCAGSQGSSFIATGRGGVPQNPTQQLRDDRTWDDLRDLSAYRQPGKTVAQTPAPRPVLLQATTWQRHADNTIELMTDQSAAVLPTVATCSGTTTATLSQ